LNECLKKGKFEDNEFLEIFSGFFGTLLNFFSHLFLKDGQNAAKIIQENGRLVLEEHVSETITLLTNFYSSYNNFKTRKLFL
jgi:hypothetical protein